MDQVKIGTFIAQLRREKGWTQEELGERLGLTNKTVSRWENGNYMPSIEMLSLLSKEFGVSLNELVEGRRLEGEDFREAADKNLARAMEGRLDKFWRWLERYGAYAAVVFLLCSIIGALVLGMYQYRQAFPGNERAAGTYCTDPNPPGTGEYIVLMDWQNGVWEYYRYRQFEALEKGRYTVNGDLVTITAAGRSFEALIKEDRLYVSSGEGELTVYSKIADQGRFINVHDEDFEE